MSQTRRGRINDELQRELSDLIRNLKDPRVQGLISVTQVEATPDLRYATAYISVLEKERSAEVLKGLRSAAGYLRRELGSRMQLRYTPELIFEEDHSIEKGARIFEILSQLEREEGSHDD
jgi:ribosome-binding factor A